MRRGHFMQRPQSFSWTRTLRVQRWMPWPAKGFRFEVFLRSEAYDKVSRGSNHRFWYGRFKAIGFGVQPCVCMTRVFAHLAESGSLW